MKQHYDNKNCKKKKIIKVEPHLRKTCCSECPKHSIKPFIIFFKSNIKYALHCARSVAVGLLCVPPAGDGSFPIDCYFLKSTGMAPCHAGALDTIMVNFARLSVQFSVVCVSVHL